MAGPSSAPGHRSAADKPADEGAEGHGASDSERSGLPDRANIGGHGCDHDHQEEREHELPSKGLDVGAGRLRDAEIGVRPERRTQSERRDGCSQDLGGGVHSHL